jgi:hypothetical protein
MNLRARIVASVKGQPVLKLSRGASTASFTLQAGPNVRLSSLNLNSAGGPMFVHTSHVNTKTADAFRRARVQFLDSAGNAWIQFGDVLIDIRGRISTEPDPTSHPHRAAGDLFSSRRSQVIMALLAWPDLWTRPQRELAEAAGVSLGQANKTLALLKQAGRGPGRPKREEVSLLDMWAAAFPARLGQRLYLGSYQGDITWRPSRDELDPPAVSGESAVPELLRPGSLTLYLRELDPNLALRQRWRADGAPNIVVRRKFWRHPRWNTSSSDDGVAPWPIVCADLLASDDPRVRAVAREVRDGHE